MFKLFENWEDDPEIEEEVVEFDKEGIITTVKLLFKRGYLVGSRSECINTNIPTNEEVQINDLLLKIEDAVEIQDFEEASRLQKQIEQLKHAI